METLCFSLLISSSKERVWSILWEDASFEDWASIIDEGTIKKGKIEEGEQVVFMSMNGGYGVNSLVKTCVPNELVVFFHHTDTQSFGQQERDDEWSGSIESYELSEFNGQTKLMLTTQVPIELVDVFNERLPMALKRIKALAEN